MSRPCESTKTQCQGEGEEVTQGHRDCPRQSENLVSDFKGLSVSQWDFDCKGFGI